MLIRASGYEVIQISAKQKLQEENNTSNSFNDKHYKIKFMFTNSRKHAMNRQYYE